MIVYRKKGHFTQNLECRFYTSAGSTKRALSCDVSRFAMAYFNRKL